MKSKTIGSLSLCLLFASLLTLALWPVPQTLADDAAHGGSPAQATEDARPQPPRSTGPAVKAPRVTTIYAEKGMAPHPIAFDFDPQGNIYLVDTGRAGISVIDNRFKGLRDSDGVIDDLRKTSVEDRVKQMNMLEEKGFFPEGIFNQADDKIHLLQDTDGDGIADKSTVFAENFNDKLDGIAAGVLYHEGKLFLTNIPHLWLLEDKDGDGDADRQTEGERVSLSYGYGIRWAFYGHDMHGLIKGPDGRIYWSIGDRGYNVKTKEGKHLYGPDTGAVFRMWPDGSEIEVYHKGLRNPQELAFDNYGNLFTGDNNSDSGDKARFVFVAEGGESGWNQDVQSLKDRGPWNREHMWKPRFRNDDGTFKDDASQPAWLIAPLANVGAGPSGLAHYPGTGDVFPDNGSFLMCDYPSGVRHVHVEPDGAGFRVVEDSSFIKGGTITDVAWGYDGRLYISDWGGGWKPNPNGHVKVIVNEAAHAEQAALIKEVKDLFANGFDKLSDKKLIELLGHRDQRVRIHAQWKASERVSGASLANILRDENASELARLHALWALGMKSRNWPDHAHFILLANDSPNANLRAQAASVLSDLDYAAPKFYLRSLEDESLAVQYHAAIALGKTGTTEHIPALLDLLDRNANQDATIRHAASYGLSLIGDAEAIHNEAKRRGYAARLGAVLALRRLESPLLAAYLDDADLLVAAEAARAIYDKRIGDAMPSLAVHTNKLTQAQMIEPILRRVVEANVRLADADSAARLIQLASNKQVPELFRLLALEEVDQWSAERNREGVWGSWWPRPEQAMDDAVSAMLIYMPELLSSSEGKVLDKARQLQQKHVSNAGPDELAAMVVDKDEADALRSSLLKMLAEADRDRGIEIAKQLAADAEASSALRIASRLTLMGLDREAGQQAYADAIAVGVLVEQQDAIHRLGLGMQASSTVPGEIFADLADQLSKGTLPPALRLELIEAVTNNKAMPAPVRLKVSQYVERNQLPGEEPFVRDAMLVGGDIERGREVFYYHEGATCTQCHRMDNEPAQGPNLAGIGAMHDMNYLYRAIVNPSADIAEGYAQTSVTLKDGRAVSGRMLASQSTPDKLVLIDEQNAIQEIARINIEGAPIVSKQSNMKAMNEALSPRELRDLLAFLGSLNDPAAVGNTVHKPGLSGPSLVKPGMGIKHVQLLPAILAGIAVLLAVLLAVTVFGGEPSRQ